MVNGPYSKTSVTPRVLMFSQRNIYKPEVWRCPLCEFEGIIGEVDSVEMLAPKPTKWFNQRKRIALRIGRDSSIILNPGIPKIRLNRYYDLFFAVCVIPSDVLNANAVEGWKDHCKTSICLLNEFWLKEMAGYKSVLNALSKFDYVLLNFSQSVEPVRKIIQGACSFVSPGIDAIRFCPYPSPPKRFIDVFSLGRRSAQTHQALLKMVKENNIFYVYDTIDDLHTFDLEEHRLLIANMAKRSRYFIVNPGKFDLPDESGDQSEIGTRYFEGAASGTIMIGEQPRNDEFEKFFFWPDAVVKVPYNSGSIEEIIRELDKQPERQKQIRRNNVVQSLLQHDWVYRWETVLKIAGLEPMPGLLERKHRLSNLSKIVGQT